MLPCSILTIFLLRDARHAQEKLRDASTGIRLKIQLLETTPFMASLSKTVHTKGRYRAFIPNPTALPEGVGQAGPVAYPCVPFDETERT